MADVFQQVYDPVAGSVLLSALVAALPPILLAILLAGVRLAPWRSAIAAAASGVRPRLAGVGHALHASPSRPTTQGMAFGLWPISWIVLSAVFFYNLSVESGDFDVIRRSLARATGDRRIQVVLVAFCFGALIEGIAGFGAPVAITASMLAGLGLRADHGGDAGAHRQHDAGRVRIARHPDHDARRPARADARAAIRSRRRCALSATAGRQLALFSIFIPPISSCCSPGWRRMIEVLPAVLTAGVSFAIGQFVVSNYVGPRADGVAVGALLARVGHAAAAGVAAARGVRRRRRGRLRPPHNDPPARVARAYGTYGILIVVVLAGQIGNFAGLSNLEPPLNLTALFRCGQIGNRLCPDPWVGEPAATDPQGFRFPVWEFNWPGAYRLDDGRPVATRPARAARRRERRARIR